MCRGVEMGLKSSKGPEKESQMFVDHSRGGCHYFLLGRMRKGLIEQVTIELNLEHLQMRGKTSRTKQKVETCMVFQKLNK